MPLWAGVFGGETDEEIHDLPMEGASVNGAAGEYMRSFGPQRTPASGWQSV